MNQYGLNLHRDFRLSIRDVSKAQFAEQSRNPPRDPDILYRVDGVIYHWTGNAWVNVPIVSDQPPDDSDGLPDGTIYIQINS